MGKTLLGCVETLGEYRGAKGAVHEAAIAGLKLSVTLLQCTSQRFAGIYLGSVVLLGEEDS